jgi:hypothetical protein
LAPQLERVGERFLMGSYKTGKVLDEKLSIGSVQFLHYGQVVA